MKKIVGLVVRAPKFAHVMFRIYILILDIVRSWIFPLSGNTRTNPRWPPPLGAKSSKYNISANNCHAVMNNMSNPMFSGMQNSNICLLFALHITFCHISGNMRKNPRWATSQKIQYQVGFITL